MNETKFWKLEIQYQAGLMVVFVGIMIVSQFFLIYLYNRIGDLVFIVVGISGTLGFIVLFNLMVFVFTFIKESITKDVQKEFEARYHKDVAEFLEHKAEEIKRS